MGEARYVLNRDTGVINVVRGPQIFLPDPRKEVITQRALPLNLCSLMYPGNSEALEINAARLGMDDQDINSGGGAEALIGAARGYDSYSATDAAVVPDTTRKVMIRAASKALPGDSFDRKNKFTAPRSIVLNTKFDGAVTTTLWTGYAMLLVRKNGERKVVQGPGTYILEYDESPQVITLSRGKPKTMDNPLKTVFLLTTANKVSDIVEVETKDFCRLNVKLSYRVNFEGDPNSWFNVDNYVKFLCDHMRSKIRSAVQKLGIEEFYGNHTDILRKHILGEPIDGKRPGTLFAENNMRIYDVEVLGVSLQNPDVEKLLVSAQREVINNTLLLQAERRRLDYTLESERLKRETEGARAETQKALLALQSENAKLKLDHDLVVIDAAAQTEQQRIKNELAASQAHKQITDLQLLIRDAEDAQQHLASVRTQELEVKKIEAQVAAMVEKAKAFGPDLIAALDAFGERAMIEKVSEAMAPLSILGGGSVVEVLKKLLEGTNLAKQLEAPVTSTSRSRTARA